MLSPMTAPSARDIRLLAVRGVAFSIAFLTAVPPASHSADTAPWIRVTAGAAAFVFVVAIAALPGLLFRGIRGDWRGFTVWLGKGLLVLAALLVVGQIRRALSEKPSGLLESLRAGRVTIDRFVRAERAGAPGVFDLALRRRHERGLQQSLGDARVSDVSLVGVSDGDGWMRAHMTYNAVFDPNGAAVATKGQIVLYYHSGGAAIIGGVCIVAEGCTGTDSVVAEADQALQRQLKSADLDGILPEAGICSIEPMALPNTTRGGQMMRCEYERGVELTFARLDAQTTVESLIAERTPAR